MQTISIIYKGVHMKKTVCLIFLKALRVGGCRQFAAGWEDYVEATVQPAYIRGLDMYVRYSRDPVGSYVLYTTKEFSEPINFDQVTQWTYLRCGQFLTANGEEVEPALFGEGLSELE